MVLNDNVAGKQFIEQMLSTKFSHWRYEQEMRLFVRLDLTTEQNGHYFADFSTEIQLAEIIVGASSSITRGQLSDALGTLAGEVRCRKGRLAFQSFKVVEQRAASLWA